MKRRPQKLDGADKDPGIDAADADARYLVSAMAGVVRLAQDPRGRVRTATAPHVSAPRVARFVTTPSAGQDIDDSSEAGFVAPGVDRRELRRLRRGEHAPGRRIDLHGMTAAEALETVKRFIDTAHHRYRCICIVHGRGLHSEGKVSILKTRVRECLSQHRAVLAYTDASQADGGAGAVYVLLRK